MGNYGDITVDSTNQMGPGAIQDMIYKAKQMNMAQAKHDYFMGVQEKTKNLENAMDSWAGKGLDMHGFFANPMESFGKPLPTMGENWKGYKNYLDEVGIEQNDPTNFIQRTVQAQQQYMGMVQNAFNAQASTLRANNPGASDSNIYKALRDSYDANQVYANMTSLGMDTSTLEYDPNQIEQSWGTWLKNAIFEPEVSVPEGGTYGGELKGSTPATLAGGTLAAVSGRQYYKGSQEFLEEAIKAYQNPKTGGLDATAFKKKYGMSKGDAFSGPKSAPLKTKKLTKAMRKYGRGEIWAGQKRKNVTKFGTKALPTAMGVHLGAGGGGALVEALGGGEGAQAVGTLGGGVAGGLTMRKVMKKLSDPKVIKYVMPILKKRAPSLAIKLGISGGLIAVPEAVTSVLGVVGAAWTAYDLVMLAKELPELYQLLAGD